MNRLNILTIWVVLQLVSCSTVPEGDSPTKRNIGNTNHYMKNGNKDKSVGSRGEGKYIVVHKYPQVNDDGTILISSDVLLKIGEEKVNLNSLIRKAK